MPDVIARRLKVLFCGINPGLYSGAVGHHFARPGNRFWKVLAASTLTPRVLSPFEERELIRLGLGITNLVERTTASADELSVEELVAGARRLRTKVLRFEPAIVAFLGLGSYRVGFARPHATVGLQPESIGRSRVWLLPNPSGLNSHYQLPELTQQFQALAGAAGLKPAPGRGSHRATA